MVFLLAVFMPCHSPSEKGSTQAALLPSKHSKAFNESIQTALRHYYDLTEAFVRWDSTSLSSLAANLSKSLDDLPISELKGDSAIASTRLAAAKADLNGINSESSLTTKRHALNSLTDHLYSFLNTAKYDGQKLYLQECPMAFNDQDAGVWISSVDSIRNPYLGLHHPIYKGGMLHCGETKEVLNNTGVK